MASAGEITIRVTEIPEVREMLEDAQRFIVAVNDFDNAVAEFGIDHPEHIGEVYQVVHDQLAELRRKYPTFSEGHG